MNETTVILILLISIAAVIVLVLGWEVGFLDVGKIMANSRKKKQETTEHPNERPVDVHEPVVGHISVFGYDKRLDAIEKRLDDLEEKANSRETIVINKSLDLDETTVRRMAEM